MESMEYNAQQAQQFIMEQFSRQGDFLELFSADALDALVGEVMALDEAYMQTSGADDGAVYDDDDAYDYMYERLCAAHPEHRMYMMRFVEDYMEFNERYLERVGAIEWE